MGKLKFFFERSIYEMIMHFYSLRFKKHYHDYKFILVFGHMRSGSSLFSHILHSHPEIIGAGEIKLNYNSFEDLHRLLCQLAWARRRFSIPEKYIMDKIVGEYITVNDKVLRNDDIFKLFIIREAAPSLASLGEAMPSWSEKRLSQHYQSRLLTMGNQAKMINNPDRSLFITYEELLNRTPKVFLALKRFLQLKEEFTESYDVIRTTGKKGFGDRWGKIKLGKISREGRTLKNKVSPHTLEMCNFAVEDFRDLMRRHCTVIEPESSE